MINLLITRPAGRAAGLMTLLQDKVATLHHQPLIELLPGPDLDNLNTQLSQSKCNDINIFVSRYAVDFCRTHTPALATSLKQSTLVAVGQSTASALAAWLDTSVITPTPENTEGMLSLPCLQQISNQRIAIFRGTNGRELLADTLKQRGASVHYIAAYQRMPITGQEHIWLDQWKSLNINCIVVTSVELLTIMLRVLRSDDKSAPDNYYWIVASQRIANEAMQQGIRDNNISVAQGASDEAILQQVNLLIGNSHDGHSN